MKYIGLIVTTLLFWSGFSVPGAIAAPAPLARAFLYTLPDQFADLKKQLRSADTCADPSVAIPYVQGFNIGHAAYALASVARYTAGLTGSPTSGWVYQGETFLAWVTQQNFTTPLYGFFNPTTTDYEVVISTDSNTPSVPGFSLQGIVGYVYSTQVCSSVPLLGARNQAAGSHYYTTDTNVHSQLISVSGWVDAGIAAYVLPL